MDGLRGIAALIVLGYHLHTVFGGFNAFRLGYFAVDFFFLLSGFVMARTYEPRFACGLGPLAFFVARFRRLAPTMAVGTFIGLLFFLSVGAPPFITLLMFAAGVAFVPIPGADQFVLNRPVWSIFFEIVANIAHAVVLWRLRTRWLLLVALVAVLLLLPYWLAGHFTLGNKGSTFLAGFPRVILPYCLGIVLYRAGFTVPAVPARWVPMASWFGALSFPLYAVHYPVLQVAEEYDAGPFVGAIAAMATALVVVQASRLRLTSARTWQRPGVATE